MNDLLNDSRELHSGHDPDIIEGLAEEIRVIDLAISHELEAMRKALWMIAVVLTFWTAVAVVIMVTLVGRL